MMDRAGVPLTTIQAILRHKSATTTDRYLHALRGAKANLNGVFGGEKKGKILEIKKASDGQSEAL
jgi:integrase